MSRESHSDKVIKKKPESKVDEESQAGTYSHTESKIHSTASSLPKEAPHGREVFFKDGKRRIDFILAWRVVASKKTETASYSRRVFENNLVEEGLELEYDLTSKKTHFLKIHAPFAVLRRYADVLKLRMPIKAKILTIPLGKKLKIKIPSLKQKLLAPCQYDKNKFPPIIRPYTCPYSASKDYLFDTPINPEDMFNNATRSWIVDYILRRKYFSNDKNNHFDFGIETMLSENYYAAAYPLHEGDLTTDYPENLLKNLYDCWAHWSNVYKYQPIDHIRLYYGETVAIYFAWLGFYTRMLIPATIVGLLVFGYGLTELIEDTISDELCDISNNITMCPLCDTYCRYWQLSSTCFHTKISRLFDNLGTVFFAIFMSLWSTLFLELWKRQEAVIQYTWDLTTFIEEEQPPRPEYLCKLESCQEKTINPITGLTEPYLPFWQRRVPIYMASYSVVLLLIAFALTAVVAVIAYRTSVFASLNIILRKESSSPTFQMIHQNASLVTTVTASIINLIIIIILDCIYTYLAFLLTDWECLRTQNEYDNSITFKLFILQFINYFSSMFYVAFFKGQFTGRPGNYQRVLWGRQEECAPSGCLIELCLQLAITMIGLQLIQNNLQEIVIPYYKRNIQDNSDDKKQAKTSWEVDYLLIPIDKMALFYEYLEMVLQFGFLAIFCCAFPLGPLIALLNNIVEIRVDATKFTTQLRRPVAMKSASIGIWYSVLFTISRLSIVTNAFIIAMTSDFIPRLMYRYEFSLDGTDIGYVNFTLAYFNTSDFVEELKPIDVSIHVDICRYKDFRNPPWSKEPYERSVVFWHILAARLAFICIFENVVVMFSSLLSWLIPDIPTSLKKQIHGEAYITNEIVLATELMRASGKGFPGNMASFIENERKNLDTSFKMDLKDYDGNRQEY